MKANADRILRAWCTEAGLTPADWEAWGENPVRSYYRLGNRLTSLAAIAWLASRGDVQATLKGREIFGLLPII